MISKCRNWLRVYYPLVIIFEFLALVSTVGSLRKGRFDEYAWIHAFMAGFFLIFAFFKLLDLKGFVATYSKYDLLAKRWHGYGYLYPFLELILGLAYLAGIRLDELYIATVILIGFSTLGIANSLIKKQKINCACVGTILNIPISWVTLAENLGMLAMALALLKMQ